LIHDRVNSAVNSGNKQCIVIVGGGATGVRCGGALSDFIKESKKSDSGSIIILEALTTILPEWDECLVNKVEEVLREKEIRIMTSSPVAKVENGGSDGIDV
jgi:NADH dehydrogenase FAD-containing subunit